MLNVPTHDTRVLTDDSRKVIWKVKPIMKNPCVEHCLWIIRGNPPPHLNTTPTHIHTHTNNPTPTHPSSLSDKSPPLRVTSVAQPTHYFQASSCRLHREPIQVDQTAHFRGWRGKCRFRWLFWYSRSWVMVHMRRRTRCAPDRGIQNSESLSRTSVYCWLKCGQQKSLAF